jgi:phage shock protein A
MTNEELIQQLKKAELVVAALQQRISELELDKAMLRAEYTMIQQAINQPTQNISEEEKSKAADDYINSITDLAKP